MKVGELSVCVLACAALVLASCASQRNASETEQRPVPPPEQSPSRQPESDATTAPSAGFVASEELYRRTFDEVQAVIAALTSIIAAGDYEGWLSYLTVDYIDQTGSPEHLAAASNAGVLKKNGIVLHSLRDYFTEVVVRSHMTATLDDITFVDATHVKAFARVQGKPVILYYLVREDGRWKVGIQQSTQNE
ncbi:MAG TPA: hypothetical protein VHE79_07780 [Spirochaetia bacterium]